MLADPLVAVKADLSVDSLDSQKIDLKDDSLADLLADMSAGL
jgi:hypothetical protein